METEFLYRKHARDIIEFVMKNGPCQKSDVYREFHKGSNITELMNKMIEHGIFLEKRPILYNEKDLEITPKGKVIRDMLVAVETFASYNSGQVNLNLLTELGFELKVEPKEPKE